MSALPLVVDAESRVVSQRASGGGLEGAENTSRELASWDVAIISPDRQINQVKDVADARGRDMVQNDGYAMGAAATHRDSIVGAQYRLNAQPVLSVLGATDGWAEEFQQWAEDRFNLLADSPECWFDASRVNTLTGMIRLAIGGFMFTGEVLSTVEWVRDSSRPFSTALQMVSPTRLSNPDGLPDDQFLSRGVKKDIFGQPLGYWIRSVHPGDMFFDPERYFNWRYIEATKPWGRRQVIHIIEQLQPGQTRGVADMVSVLKQMKMTGKFQDVVLQNAVVNASYAAAVESELPKEMVGQQMGVGQPTYLEQMSQYMTALSSYVDAGGTVKVDGVKIPHLFPGTKLNMKPMGTPGGVGTEFEESLLRHTAAGLGMSYEEFSKDFTKTNYSSARAAMGNTLKFMSSRKKFVADRYANHAYSLWLEEQINAGNAPLPKGMTVADYYNDPLKREALSHCSWIGASRGQIDEMKETQAAILRINNGLSTLEMETARLGEDYRKVLTQAAREKRMKEKLGLDFTGGGAEKPGANTAQQTVRGKSSAADTQDDGEL